VSDKAGLVELGRGLVDLGFELVSTGGTARTLRDAGLPVTDVAAVTGLPEMLDGRVKTLHPRIHAGILADRRSADHRRQLAAAAIAPFEIVVVNLYPFAAAAARPAISLDELVEQIDIGGPPLAPAAAKNHAAPGRRAREGRDPALWRKPPPAGGPLPTAGRDGFRRPVRHGRAAAPGQDALVQQRPGRLRRRRDRAIPAAPRVRHRQAHEPM